MKFDYIIQNPPYNPNSLWKKFVLKYIDLLNKNGKMVVIHPDSWRTSSKHTKLCEHLKEHISELHIKGFTAFPGIGISTDWYVYNKQKQNKCKVYYENNEYETIQFEKDKVILPIPSNSIPYSILNKITSDKNNGAILSNTGFNNQITSDKNNGIIMLKGWDVYNNTQTKNGKYKQCGGTGNGTGWTIGNFTFTEYPTKHQFENKVVMSYVRRPRAQYFSAYDEIGVLVGNYWLTDNQSLPILLNSKMLWQLGIELTPQEINRKTKGIKRFPNWFLKSLNFDNLNVQNEEELYQHFNLTKEEIDWINI